jgi:hypothetical protein
MPKGLVVGSLNTKRRFGENSKDLGLAGKIPSKERIAEATMMTALWCRIIVCRPNTRSQALEVSLFAQYVSCFSAFLLLSYDFETRLCSSKRKTRLKESNVPY